MEKGRKYIVKKSINGRYFLHIEIPEYNIDQEKKTKLWVSSPFLFLEALDDDPALAIKTLNLLISWNESSQNFEACSKLIKLKNSFKK